MQKVELNLKQILGSKNVRILKFKEIYNSKLKSFQQKYPERMIFGYTNSLHKTSIEDKFSKLSLENSKIYEKTENVKNTQNNFLDGIEIPLNAVPLAKEGIVHKVFYCAAAVGTPIFSQHKQLHVLPTGYHSFLTIYDSIRNKEKTEIQTSQVISEVENTENFSYILKTQRVLPLYEIEFEYDPSLDTFDGKCDSCTEKDAIMYCYAERAHLCENCDAALHNNPLTKRHKREYFSNNQADTLIYMNCTIHRDITVEYFCKDCLIPICVECRVKGSHASTNPAEHRLISYIEATKTFDINFNSLKEKEKMINSALQKIKLETNLFEKNVTIIKEKIESEFKSAMNELNTFINKNYRIYNAEFLQYLNIKKIIEKMKKIVSKLNNAEKIENFKGLITALSNVKVDLKEASKYFQIDLDGILRIYKVTDTTQRYKKEVAKNLEFSSLSKNYSKKKNSREDDMSDMRSFRTYEYDSGYMKKK